MEDKLNIIDEEAINKVLWLSDYCKLQRDCNKCILQDFKNASVYCGEQCILMRSDPAGWKINKEEPERR